LAGKSLVAQNTVVLRKLFSRNALKLFSGGTALSNQGLLEYIVALAKIYGEEKKARKGQLLRDAQAITGRSERTLLRYLGQDIKGLEDRIAQGKPIAPGRGRPPKYQLQALLPFIKALWILMERICSSRMHEGLKEWLVYYEHPDLTDHLRQQLKMMSRGTLERALGMIRAKEHATNGLSTTTSALRNAKNQVPLNRYDQVITRPGFAQADTVAHCGTSAGGEFISTLTMTDVFSSWTANSAMLSKKAVQVRHCFREIKKELPFILLAVNTDSGSEFINTPMVNFMSKENGTKPITFTRSRPYKKNDNCYVEQKNFTHVRSLFGYERLEDLSLVGLMNEIYQNYWNPLNNFFLPSQKLKEKVRVGAKIVKKHDRAKTPYDRLLASPELTEAQKEILKERKSKLNPVNLARELEVKLGEFFKMVKTLKNEKQVQSNNSLTDQRGAA
jgi:hypothetical protein